MSLPSSAEAWAASLLRWPEDRFFRLYRFHLGDFPRPFHKHRLVEDLYAYFLQPPIRQSLLASLHLAERRFLCLLRLSPPGSLAFWAPDVRHLFTDFTDGNEPERILHNLEERLLVFRHPTGEEEVILPSPLITGPEWDAALHPARVFAGSPLDTVPNSRWSEAPWTAALLVAAEICPCPKRQLLQRLEKIMPASNVTDLLDQLMRLGVLEEAEKVSLSWTTLESLASRTAEQRFAAALGASNSEQTSWAAQVLTALPRDRGWDAASLPYLPFTVTTAAAALRDWAWGLARYWMRHQPEGPPYTAAVLPPSAAAPRLQINPSGEGLAENPDLEMALWLSRCCRLLQYDRALRLQLEEAPTLRYLGSGGDLTKLLSALARLTGSPLPPNLESLLREWAQKAHQVTVRRGVVLRLQGPYREAFLAQAQQYTLHPEELAEGIYVLPQAEWQDLVRNSLWPRWSLFPALDAGQQPPTVAPPPPAPSLPPLPPPPPASPADPILEQALEEFLRDKPEGPQKLAFQLLLQRRLPVDPTRLEHYWDEVRPQEIQGLLHQAKAQLLEGVLSRGNTLLLVVVQEGASQRSMVVRPTALVRRSGQLVLQAREEGSGESSIELPVHRLARIVTLRHGI